MMIPRPPTSGFPVSADWGRAVVEVLRRLRLMSGPGIRITQTPEGTTIAADPAAHRTIAPGPIIAIITGGSAAAGYSVDLYASGVQNESTGTGTLFLTDVAVDGHTDLLIGTAVLAHPGTTLLIGDPE